jgi:choline dehydrogenase
LHDGKTRRIAAGTEVILSLGAIQTPKVLMQSGIGNENELRRLGIPVVQHLPGVGQNFQDQVGFDCVWETRETRETPQPRNNLVEATYFWKSDGNMASPDLQTCLGEFTKTSAENAAKIQSSAKRLDPIRRPPATQEPWFDSPDRPRST